MLRHEPTPKHIRTVNNHISPKLIGSPEERSNELVPFHFAWFSSLDNVSIPYGCEGHGGSDKKSREKKKKSGNPVSWLLDNIRSDDLSQKRTYLICLPLICQYNKSYRQHRERIGDHYFYIRHRFPVPKEEERRRKKKKSRLYAAPDDRFFGTLGRMLSWRNLSYINITDVAKQCIELHVAEPENSQDIWHPIRWSQRHHRMRGDEEENYTL